METKAGAPSRAQRLAKKGDIFYQMVRPYQKNNYLFQDKTGDNFVFSTGYAQLRPSISSTFLLSVLQQQSFVNHVMAISTGTSYPAVNASDLARLHILVPTSVGEMELIGTVISHCDDIIAHHQRH